MTDTEQAATLGFLHSASFAACAVALAKAQAGFTTPKKDIEVDTGKYKYNYADLAAIREACSKQLSEQGLVIVQPVEEHGGELWLVTLLVHGESGEYLGHRLPLGPLKMRPQDFGSALTYMRRYGLSTLLGIATEDDDDGRAAQEAHHGDDARGGGQREAFDTGRPAPGFNYSREAGVLKVRFAEAGPAEDTAIEADATNLDTDQLHKALEHAKRREARYHADDRWRARMMDAQRDQQVLRKLIDTRELEAAADDAAEDADETPGESSPPATTTEGDEGGEDQPPADGPQDPAPDPEADAEREYEAQRDEQQPNDENPPKSGQTLPVMQYRVHIGMDAPADVLRTSIGISDQERGQLAYLDRVEVIAMLLAPENAALFDPAGGKELARFNDAGAEPLTGDWLARAWLLYHESDKERRRDARKLLRLAIVKLDLATRAENEQVPEIQTQPAVPAESTKVIEYLAGMMSTADVKFALAEIIANKEASRG